MRVEVQHLLDDFPSLERNGLGHVKQATSAYFAVELFFWGAVEGKHARKHNKENDAQSPDIGREARIFLFLDYLRRHVGRRAAEDF